MATNKTISLSDDIALKLKGEANASSLIDNLLRQHYDHLGLRSKEELMKTINELKAEEEKVMETLTQVTVHEKEIASVEQTNIDKEKERADAWLNSAARWDKLRELQHYAWEAYEGTEEQFTLFFQDLKDGRTKNLVTWTNDHGIHKKTIKKLNDLSIAH